MSYDLESQPLYFKVQSELAGGLTPTPTVPRRAEPDLCPKSGPGLAGTGAVAKRVPVLFSKMTIDRSDRRPAFFGLTLVLDPNLVAGPPNNTCPASRMEPGVELTHLHS